MADEIKQQYPEGTTLYSIIRDLSLLAWNTSTNAFETWADGNVGVYDIPLTYAEGGFHKADFPTAIGLGRYVISTFIQTGASPSVSDSPVGSIELEWSGTSVVFSATSGALTTVANYKTYAGITSSDDDDLIQDLIYRATSAIEAFCGRTLTSNTYRERYDGQGDNILWAEQTPITDIQLLAVGTTEAIKLTHSNTDAYNGYATVDDTNLTLVVQGGANDSSNELALASYTATTLITAIAALDVGWSAELLSTTYTNWAATELLPVAGIRVFDTTTATLKMPNEPLSILEFDGGSGRITISGKFWTGTQNVTIRYTAGYVTTPADLEQITIDLVNTYYLSRQLDTTVMEERLGDHRVKYADSQGVSVTYRDLPEGFRRRLGPYVRFRL